MADNQALAARSKNFALKTIKLSKYLANEKKETYMSQQFLASGTMIGANVREALLSPGSAAYQAKMRSAMSQANAAAYWLELLFESDYIDKKIYEDVFSDCQELIRSFVALVVGKENMITH